jgi:hypothetical protein
LRNVQKTLDQARPALIYCARDRVVDTCEAYDQVRECRAKTRPPLTVF